MKIDTNLSDSLVTPEKAAEFLGVSKKTLAVWRSTGRYDLPYVKSGSRVRYRSSALNKFANRRTIVPNAPEVA